MHVQSLGVSLYTAYYSARLISWYHRSIGARIKIITTEILLSISSSPWVFHASMISYRHQTVLLATKMLHTNLRPSTVRLRTKIITTAESHVTRPHLKEEGLQIDDTHELGLRAQLCALFSKPMDALHGAADTRSLRSSLNTPYDLDCSISWYHRL
jgi:hypothetical protein